MRVRLGLKNSVSFQKGGYSNFFPSEQVEKVQVIFDRGSDTRNRPGANFLLGVSVPEYLAYSLTVLQVLRKVRQQTIYQAEDSGFFLSRDFMFTSRTVGVFLSAIGKNYTVHLSGNSNILKGVRRQPETAALPAWTEELLLPIKDRWQTIANSVGITEGGALKDVTASA